MKIAVCVHLYHTHMWNEIMNYLENIDVDYELLISLPIDTVDSVPTDLKWEEYYDLYDDLKLKLKHNQETAINHWIRYGNRESRYYKKNHFDIEKEILKFKPDTKIFLTENKGMDIGGFLQVYQNINSDVKLILKIHTKSCLGGFKNKLDLDKTGEYNKAKNFGHNWFNDLMNGVLKNKLQIKNILYEFENNENCGMVGYKLYNNYKKNTKYINDLSLKLKINQLDLNNSFFIGGTIFWVDNDILKKYLNKNNVEYILNLLKSGYNYEPSYSHAMERMFGYFVYNEGKVIKVIN